ncbi:MAG: hypothetical protein QOE34_411, partial [Verrucomicrobiota bacterium]
MAIDKYRRLIPSTIFHLKKKVTMIGKNAAAIIEATETYRVVSNVITQIRNTVSTAKGIRPKSAPAEVATPFPPLNRSQIGNECPATQAT